MLQPSITYCMVSDCSGDQGLSLVSWLLVEEELLIDASDLMNDMMMICSFHTLLVSGDRLCYTTLLNLKKQITASVSGVEVRKRAADPWETTAAHVAFPP